MVDLLKQIYDAPAKLSDIGITAARSAKVYQLVAGMSASIPPNEAKRKQLEAQVSDSRTGGRGDYTASRAREERAETRKRTEVCRQTFIYPGD